MEGMGEKTGKILVPATFGKAPARERERERELQAGIKPSRLQK
jgi:hypothetical protein